MRGNGTIRGEFVRNLTIKRERSFVSCIIKMKVYIEDAVTGEILINDVAYRKIGELKNGEEKTFCISEEACNIIVIAGRISRNYCNDLYKIPAGEEDIFLSGKNVFNIVTGNAFRFNGVTDSDVLQNRKKGFKKGLVVLSIAYAIGAILGYASYYIMDSQLDNPIVFSKAEMTITLTDDFHESSRPGYTVCYESKKTAVIALKEYSSLLYFYNVNSLYSYGNRVIINNNLYSSVTLQSKNGLTYFEYESHNYQTNDDFCIFAVIFETSDSYWLVQFVTLKKDYNSQKEAMIDWAKSIKFSNS